MTLQDEYTLTRAREYLQFVIRKEKKAQHFCCATYTNSDRSTTHCITLKCASYQPKQLSSYLFNQY